MNKIVTILLLVMSLAFSGEATKSPADQLYDKVMAENTKDVLKAYIAYTKTVDAANVKIIAALEAAKKAVEKNNSMSISERAKALEELDGRIKAVEEGAVKELMVAKDEEYQQLLGVAKADLKIVGKWIRSDNIECNFLPNGTGTIGNSVVKWTIVKDSISVTFPNQPNWFMNLKKSVSGFDALLDDGRTVTLVRKTK